MKLSKGGFSFYVGIIGLCLIAGGLIFPAYGHEEEKKDLPPRAISVAPEYSGVIVSQGENVSVDLKVINKGRQDEIIELTLPSVPKGWTATVKTYSFGVTGVYMESDKTRNLTLKAEPDESVGPGKYTFLVKGQTQDGKLTSSGKVVITRNWDIKFKPAYEDKYFSSLRIKKGQTESMAVEVKPYLLAEPNRYPLKVKVSSPEAKGEAEITVVLTGTYKLDAGTADGRLSLSALRGKEANLSFYVKNTGSAKQNTVKFLSFKPENWKVEFKPETLETLAPGDLKQGSGDYTGRRGLGGRLFRQSCGGGGEGQKEPGIQSNRQSIHRLGANRGHYHFAGGCGPRDHIFQVWKAVKWRPKKS
jgi:hypothetical protein